MTNASEGGFPHPHTSARAQQQPAQMSFVSPVWTQVSLVPLYVYTVFRTRRRVTSYTKAAFRAG